jgi:hypothetical protein
MMRFLCSCVAVLAGSAVAEQAPGHLSDHMESNGDCMVDGIVSGVPVQLLVDTGSEMLAFSPEQGKRLGIDISHLDYNGRLGGFVLRDEPVVELAVADRIHHVPACAPQDDLPFKMTAFEIDHCGAPRRQRPPSYVR